MVVSSGNIFDFVAIVLYTVVNICQSFLLTPADFRSLTCVGKWGATKVNRSVLWDAARMVNKMVKNDGSSSRFVSTFCFEESDGEGGSDAVCWVNSASEVGSRATRAT